jgi:hypothetical protein
MSQEQLVENNTTDLRNARGKLEREEALTLGRFSMSYQRRRVCTHVRKQTLGEVSW